MFMESQSNNRRPEDQDTKSSSEEELEAEDHVNDGARRSYECVFCKRGFTTAQALGGHMNIHRKERSARPSRPSSAPTSIKAPEDHDQQLNHAAVMRSLRSMQSYTGPHFAAYPEVDYRTYIPAPTRAMGLAHEEFYGRNNYPGVPRHLQNLFGKDEEHDQGWRSGSGLRLGIGPSSSSHDDDINADGDHEHRNGEMKVNNGGCSEGDGLDLELRLGHDP